MVFDDVISTLASWLLVGCTGWAALLCAGAAVEAYSRGRIRATAWLGCPRPWRRALLATAGALLTAGPFPGPISASARTCADPAAKVAPGRTDTRDSLPVPTRLPGSDRGALRAHVVIRPGDTLWQIASARVPPSASAGEVAGLVRRLHRSNRAVIGPDPDLIRPGQRLVISPSDLDRHHEEIP